MFKIGASKTTCRLIPRKLHIVLSGKSELISFSYNLKGALNPRVPFVRDLGVRIDSLLFFQRTCAYNCECCVKSVRYYFSVMSAVLISLLFVAFV